MSDYNAGKALDSARRLRKAKKFSEALKTLEPHEKTLAENPRYQREVLLCLYHEGRDSEKAAALALRIADNIQLEAKLRVEACLFGVILAGKRNDIAGAEMMAEKANALDADHPLAIMAGAHVSDMKGDDKEALELLELIPEGIYYMTAQIMRQAIQDKSFAALLNGDPEAGNPSEKSGSALPLAPAKPEQPAPQSPPPPPAPRPRRPGMAIFAEDDDAPLPLAEPPQTGPNPAL